MSLALANDGSYRMTVVRTCLPFEIGFAVFMTYIYHMPSVNRSRKLCTMLSTLDVEALVTGLTV